jgi:predicted phosphoribosyltransferase
MSIGNWYLNFSQTSDEEVIDLLHRAWRRESGTSASGQENSDV